MQNVFHIFKHEPVFKTEHPDPDRVQILFSFEVPFLRKVIEMYFAVKFDCERLFGTIKIEHINSDTMLPSELPAFQLPGLEYLPKLGLRRGQILPKLSANQLQYRSIMLFLCVVRRHFTNIKETRNFAEPTTPSGKPGHPSFTKEGSFLV